MGEKDAEANLQKTEASARHQWATGPAAAQPAQLPVTLPVPPLPDPA
jgi:hypothetical protein